MTAALCINGILSDGVWNDDAARWFTAHGCYGQSYKYWCGIARLCPRWAWPPLETNDTRAATVANIIASLWGAGHRPVKVVAHSNGNIIVEKVAKLLLLSGAQFEFHALAGDVSPDFEATGMNTALRQGTISEVYAYCSWGDDVLASDASLWGSGALGRVGPVHVDPAVRHRVHVIREDTYGHSDWVGTSNGLNTGIMEMVLNPQPALAIPPGAV